MLQVLSCLSCAQLFATLWTVVCQAPLSMGILQIRILEWVARSSFRRSFQIRNRTQISCIVGGFFTAWATREAQILEWVVYPFSRGSAQPRNWTRVSHIAGNSSPAEPPGKPPDNTTILYINWIKVQQVQTICPWLYKHFFHVLTVTTTKKVEGVVLSICNTRIKISTIGFRLQPGVFPM